jgi:MOSC domain-containing protein YiiM
MNGTLTGTLKGIATRPAKRAAMVTHAAIAIHAAAGLDGDFGRKPGRAQVTLLAWEKWQAACAELDASPEQVPWTFRRANLLLAGVRLEPIAGQRIAIGPVVLEITTELDPCIRMEQQFTGLQNALMPDARGGVRTTIITDGTVSLGDPVQLL